MPKLLRKPQEVDPGLSLGERRAMRAVREGSVIRKYTAKGNTLMCGNISSAVLWRLEKRGYLIDAHSINSTTYRVLLSVRGREIYGRYVSIQRVRASQ